MQSTLVFPRLGGLRIGLAKCFYKVINKASCSALRKNRVPCAYFTDMREMRTFGFIADRISSKQDVFCVL